MLKITCEGVYYKNGGFVLRNGPAAYLPAPEKARGGHHGPRDSEGPQYRRQYGGAGHLL